METSLSSKGYSIPNTPINLSNVKKDLVVKPYVLPDYDFNNKPFPVYRKNSSKIYLPKFYGIEKYGPPNSTNERIGEDISLEFKGDLKELQKSVVNKIHNIIETKDSTVLSLGTGYGKCLAKDTGIIMFDGSIKKVQNIQIGDIIMGDDNTPRNILTLNKGNEEMFEIKPEKGESYTVNKSHILSLKFNNKVVDIPIQDYLNKPTNVRNSFKGYRVQLEFNEKQVKIDPYIVGSWLIVPDIYKINSKQIRLKLLAGLIDSIGVLNNGPNNNGQFTINQKNYTLSENIKFLCRSLGFECYVTKLGAYYRLIFYGADLHTIPCVLEKNKVKFYTNSTDLSYSFEVIPKGLGDYYGFEIDGNRRFVLESFDVTHNTVIALYLVSLIKKKTIIIVHKEFLLNQWIERIKQFLPTARIGIIQQNKVDIENKDIVIAMLQSISVRKVSYPKETFDSFHFSVIDECFKHNQLIVTNMGLIKIGVLFKMWVKKEKSQLLKAQIFYPKILSYNINKNIFEYKKIKYAWEKDQFFLIKINHDWGCFECTHDHLIYTPNGYVKAKNLKIGDLIQCCDLPLNIMTSPVPLCGRSEGVLCGLPEEVPLLTEAVKVISIENVFNQGVGYNGKVYDIEVENNHNFVLATGPIVHNCHRICSKTFSKALFQIATKKSLGLSATPDRKDGLSKVLNWFIGDITEIKSTTEELKPEIKTVIAEYETIPIPTYNTMGKINLPNLVTQISIDPKRNQQILNEIIICNQDNRRILILSERRRQCSDLLDLLPSGISGGLYVGGMKNEDLEISNTKDVILATYSMAHEGYDNSRLDTLIMATGRSSIIQACGRILRRKNDNIPLIIDFQDEIDGLLGQAKKREQYYRKKKYVFLNPKKTNKLQSLETTVEQMFLED